MKTSLFLVGFVVVAHATATARVVADEACPHFAVDVASYATCDGNKVASAGSERRAKFPDAKYVPLAKRTQLGIYADAIGAYQMKSADPTNVIFIDVRSTAEVELHGHPVLVDFHQPYVRRTADSEAVIPSFGSDLAHRLESAQVDYQTLILLIGGTGEHSARAADELAKFGFTHVVNVIDGVGGDQGIEQCACSGWKNAGLPWTTASYPALTGRVEDD